VNDSKDRLHSDLRRILQGFDPVPGEFHASVLALFQGRDFESSEILLTKRSQTVVTHVGQVAFPGGRVEAEDLFDPVKTAMREAREETGIPVSCIQPAGFMPQVPTVMSGFFVIPVLAAFEPGNQPVPLVPCPKEVERAGWVKVSSLRQSRREEPYSMKGREILLPVFQWEGDRVWGLTALIFDSILRRYDSLGA
jgi:8-oxo-dGTP pyrophosphatase MutT (NUDIX family)